MMSNLINNKPFSREELEWAIDLMEKEYTKDMRNTPEKMAKLIRENLDRPCGAEQIASFFGFVENYELETKKIENYAMD